VRKQAVGKRKAPIASVSISDNLEKEQKERMEEIRSLLERKYNSTGIR